MDKPEMQNKSPKELTPEQLSAAQDKMLKEAMSTGKPSLWDRLNNWLWPDCPMCAGWRGIAIGTITTALIALYLTYGI